MVASRPPSPSSAEPLAGGPALRTVSLPKDEFDSVTNSLSGLWRFSMNARAGPAHAAPPHSPPAGGAGPAVSVNVGAVTSPRGSASRRVDPPRSFLGLPILSCRDSWYSVWVLLILLLDLTYSAYLVPLSIAFQVNDLEWTWACFLDLAAGFFFAAELFLGFHVSYLASNAGQRREVKGEQAVARYYVRRGSFWQDALSVAVWLTQIALLIAHQGAGVAMADSSVVFQYIRIIRMVRFLTVLRQITSYAVTAGAGGGSLIPGLRVPAKLAQALSISYAAAALLHFFACLWNFIAAKEGMQGCWMNTVAALVRRYSADGASPLTAAELSAVPPGERYSVAFYFSAVTIATLGYGDVVPVTVAEWWVSVFVIAVGVLLFGLAMGSLGEVVTSSSKEARQAQLYREKIETINAWMHSSSVSRPLKRKIRAFYAGVWLRHAASRSNASAEQFRELPHVLRQEVAWELNRKLLTRLPLFRELDDSQRYALAGMLVPLDVTPGQELCLHGDLSDRIWLLHEGEVQVFDECSVANVVSGPAVLGVEALLQHVDTACASRPYGFRTVTACTLWEVHLEELLPYLLANLRALDALSSRAHDAREAEAEGRHQYAKAAAQAAEGEEGGEAAALAGGGAGLPPADGGQGEEDEDGSSFSAEYSSNSGSGSGLGLVAAGETGGAGTGDAWAAAAAGGLEHGSGQAGAGGLGELQQACFYATPDPGAGLAAAAAGVPAACGEDVGAPATKGEVFHLVADLRQEVVQKLDSLGEDMRRAFAAASLAQSVAAQRTQRAAASARFALSPSPTLSRAGLGPSSSMLRGRRMPGGRVDSRPEMGGEQGGGGQHIKWSFGQLTGRGG